MVVVVVTREYTQDKPKTPTVAVLYLFTVELCGALQGRCCCQQGSVG